MIKAKKGQLGRKIGSRQGWIQRSVLTFKFDIKTSFNVTAHPLPTGRVLLKFEQGLGKWEISYDIDLWPRNLVRVTVTAHSLPEPKDSLGKLWERLG